jgi:protein-tyrosine-phosphatase
VTANLLVVCTANIARSPLAEALLQVHVRVRGLEDEVRIASAGTRAREGYAAAQPSVVIAAGWGVDLRRHRSQPVTDELLEASDLIVTMTEVHRDALGGRGAGVAERCFTLYELRRLLHGVEVAMSPQDPPQNPPQASSRAVA